MLLSRVNPSVVLPGLLVPQTQEVDFMKYIGSKTNLVDTAAEMLYLTTVNNINSEASVGQQWNSELTNQTYSLGQIALPAYRINAYVEYNEDEQAKFEALSNGVALPEFLSALAEQAINQRKHQGILFGFDNSLNQGIVANATVQTLPADSAGNLSLLTYEVAELASFLGGVARSVMDATFGMAKPCVIASSNRVCNYLSTAVIPFGQSANDGGVDSVAGLFKRMIGEWLGVGMIQMVADDLLKGKDTDTILFIAPGLEAQMPVDRDVNQNIAGGMANSISYNTMVDCGLGLVRKDRPEDAGNFSSVYTYKMTPGASLRSEAVVKLEVPYN